MIFSDTIGGVVVADPFRWLEDDADPAVIDWQANADRLTQAELGASPHAAAAAAAVRATYADLFTFAAPQHFGATWFRPVLREGGAGVVLEVSDSPTAQGRVLVDPAADGPDCSLMAWQPSPDGRLVLAGINVGGLMHLRLLDVADGRVVRDFGAGAPRILHAWAHDNSGFFFQTMGMTTGADGQSMPETQILWQPLEGEPERQPLALDHPVAWPVVSADGRWVGVFADQTAPRLRWVRRVDGRDWVRVLAEETAMYKGAFVGDELWAITDDLSGWCRLVAIPLASCDDRSTWRELLPAREEIKLASITRCGDRMAVSTIESGTMRLRSLDLDGRDCGEVDLPGEGAFGHTGVGHIMSILGDIVCPDGDACTLVHSTLARGPGVYRADLVALKAETLIAPEPAPADLAVERFTAEGPQGPVAYWVLRKGSTPLDGSAPVIVTGYGGFNVPWIPYYSAMGAAWSELGGIWVHCQLRGGGERDKAFWQAGRMHRKQGTFDDFFAAISDLQARGLARPERTGVWGSSNGGLLVGATVTQRPELIRAAVAQVPILDLLQCRKDPGTVGICMADYGNPDDPTHAPVMHAYSPYHRVREGVGYPALLCDAGAADVMCPPWHSRKMVAAVEAATASGRRTLLRVRAGAGHNQMTTDHAIARDIEELTFFCDELTA